MLAVSEACHCYSIILKTPKRQWGDGGLFLADCCLSQKLNSIQSADESDDSMPMPNSVHNLGRFKASLALLKSSICLILIKLCIALLARLKINTT